MASTRHPAAIGLGANEGDRRANLRAAVKLIGESPRTRINEVSALYETAPWGKTDQPDFLNAAVRIETGLTPRALLERILEIERSLGRIRGERWGPRPIDLDILLYGEGGGTAVDEAGLTVPHPHLAERAFVLLPLADVWPEAVLAGRSVRSRAEWIDSRGVKRIEEPEWAKEG